MTIIQLNRKGAKRSWITALFVGLLLTGVVLGIGLYNATVNLKHDVASLDEELQNLKVKNAELKDTMYQMFDTASFPRVAADAGLVLDRSPRYIETSPDTLAAKL